MKKKLISFILTFIMSISGFIPALSVNAADAADADALLLNVSGQLNWEVQFQPDELEAAKDWIKTSKEVGEEWIQKELARTTDTYKIDLLQTGLAESASLDTDSFFSVQPDGAADMDVSLANFTLTWDNGVSVVTDENGYYTLENVSAGAHTVKITQDDFILSEETVTIQSDQDIQAAPGQADEQQMNGGSAITADITISRTSADLSASIEDMAASMADSALQSALPDNAPAIAPQSYRIGEFVGRLAVFSNGVIKGTGDGSAAVNFDSKGVTYVNDDPEDLRVTCQRNNMTLEDSAMFPLNGSDCSISIGLGALANHDKSLYRVYYNSLYCWYEANPGPVQQRYCNNDDYVWIYAEDGDKTDASGRKYKQGASKNGHINCSWFNGIGHTENMHLETPLFLTVSDDTWNPSYQSQDSQAIQVETNYNYWKVISSDSSWLRPDEFRVEYDEQNYRSLVLSVDENSSASPRTGIITVFTGGGTENFDPDEADPNCVKTITVTQPGSGLGVDVDPKFWDADYQAQSKEFTVTTSYDHWFAESSDTSWLTVSPSEYHQGDPIPIDTLTLHILQNNGSTERKAVVYVRTGQTQGSYDYEVSIAVTQQPKLEYTLEVSPLDFDLSYAAQTKTASVVTNCAPWDAVVSSDASWLTVSLASSTSGKASLTLQVTENTGTAERTGTVTVSTQAPPLEKIITVKQQAKVSASIRYTALVLDITGSMLGTPIQATKQAAIKFCEAAATAKGVNYVALVTYASSASTRVNFTTDTNALTAAINGLSASGGTNTNSGIVRAGELLDAVPGANLIKNIVLMSDGLPNSGITSSTGPYTRSQYGYYGYANAAYNTATGMHKRFSIYTLGFFHSVTSSERSFATLFMSDLQNSGYYEVTNVDDLDFIFGRIANISNSNSYRVIHINCPVDVKVYDSQNALAASIVNEVAEGVINSSVTAQIDEDGQKTFVLPDGEAYSIQITAREDCDMTYSIQEYNRALSQVTRAVNYLDVPLKQSDLYTGQAENLEDTPDAEYQLIDPDGDVVEKSEDLRDGDVITYNVDIQTQGAGTATGEGERVRGEFSQLTAQPTSGAQFLGWYVRNNRVSTDPSFRFCVLANTSLEAIFTSADIQASEITVNVGEGGSVEGGGLYAPNKNVYLIAIPDSDKTFLGWYEGDVKIAGTEELYFEAAEDRTLEARFSYDIPQQKFLLSGKVKSYNPHNPVTLSLQTENEAAKEITIAAEPDAPAGLAEQSFQFIDITPGTYTLYITKPAHVSYTIHNIVVTDADLDLTQDNRDQVKLIAMLVGDLDSDGHINVQDLNTVWSRSNYNKSVATPDVNARCDLDGNGQINVTDLNLLWSRTNYNKSAVVVEYDS